MGGSLLKTSVSPHLRSGVPHAHPPVPQSAETCGSKEEGRRGVVRGGRGGAEVCRPQVCGELLSFSTLLFPQTQV